MLNFLKSVFDFAMWGITILTVGVSALLAIAAPFLLRVLDGIIYGFSLFVGLIAATWFIAHFF